jgi:signal transduction histidine kinase
VNRDGDEMSCDRFLEAMIELASADRADWDDTIQQLLRLDADVLDVERVSFWTPRDRSSTLPEQRRTLVCEMAYERRSGVFERGATLLLEGHKDFFATLVRAEPIASNDCRSDPRVLEELNLRGCLEARNISSLLVFPVLRRGELAGLLWHGHVGQPRLWSELERHVAAAFARTASAALEARAHANAEEDALRADFLDRTSRTLGETLEVDEVARRAMTLAVPRLADGADIVLVDEDGIRRVVFDYVSDEGRALLQPVLPLGPIVRSRRYIDRTIARRDSVLVPDLTDAYVGEIEDLAFATVARQLGTRSFITAPMFVGERITGVVTMGTSAHRYGLDDLRLVEDFTRRLAAAMENARLHERLQAALQRAEDAVRVRDEFIALAGHELRTPLTALRLTAQRLGRRTVNAPREESDSMVGRLLEQLERLERLETQMLGAAQISARRLPLVRAPADLAEIARETADTFSAPVRQQGCRIAVRAEEPVVGEWDAAQLEQVVSSLLDNAVKFGKGKPVEIAVHREGDDASVSVTDHGPGIPPNRVFDIFRAFERAVSASHYGGLGLGLYIAKAIVEGHGGTLTVDNHPGEGATFTARLPLRPEPAGRLDVASAEASR